MFNVKNIANELKSEGFNVLEVSEFEFEQDGIIVLGQMWHIQVGKDYFMIVQEVAGGLFLYRAEANNVPELFKCLRKFKSEIT